MKFYLFSIICFQFQLFISNYLFSIICFHFFFLLNLFHSSNFVFFACKILIFSKIKKLQPISFLVKLINVVTASLRERKRKREHIGQAVCLILYCTEQQYQKFEKRKCRYIPTFFLNIKKYE